eukprot:1846158-Pleurochrysis_carterae.AAC.1
MARSRQTPPDCFFELREPVPTERQSPRSRSRGGQIEASGRCEGSVCRCRGMAYCRFLQALALRIYLG